MNNLSVHSVTDNLFASYFGFTESEVREILEYYNLSDCFDKIKKWYNGYLFGETEIYNQWSVLKYIQFALNNKNHILQTYWVNTSSNSIIHELITKSDRKTKNDIETLITGGSIDKQLYDDITYANMNVKFEYIWSFLLYTVYLKPAQIYQKGIYSYFTAVIPEIEIITTYENTFRQWFNESIRKDVK